MAKEDKKRINRAGAPPIAGIYLLGLIGSAVHFVDNSVGLGEFVLAVLKAFVWPAFLIHRVFDLLQI